MSYRILYSRDDVARLSWNLWLSGYINFEEASKEVKRLQESNKDFTFRVEKGTKEEVE